ESISTIRRSNCAEIAESALIFEVGLLKRLRLPVLRRSGCSTIRRIHRCTLPPIPPKEYNIYGIYTASRPGGSGRVRNRNHLFDKRILSTKMHDVLDIWPQLTKDI